MFSSTVLEALSDVDSAIDFVTRSLEQNIEHIAHVTADYKQGMAAEGDVPDKHVLDELISTTEMLKTKLSYTKTPEARTLFTETYGNVLESMTSSNSIKIKALEELAGSDNLLDKVAFNSISQKLMQDISEKTVDIVDSAYDEMLNSDTSKIN